jgi:hypothetical protein
MLRAFEKEKGFEAIQKDMIARLKAMKTAENQNLLMKALSELGADFEATLKQGPEALNGNARGFAMTLTRIYIGTLLAEFAEQTENAKDVLAAQLWLRQRSLKMQTWDISKNLI